MARAGRRTSGSSVSPARRRQVAVIRSTVPRWRTRRPSRTGPDRRVRREGLQDERGRDHQTTPSRATVTACRWVLAGTRRCPTSTSVSPLISDHRTKASTPKVVTLMPPAVPALPPPMNISTSVANRLSGVIAAMSRVLKPAVRAIAPAKKRPAAGRRRRAPRAWRVGRTRSPG